MNPHRGINSSNVAGEGLEGLPGLWMTIAFLVVEAVATVAYILSGRRD
jgi:hypothetical protein